MLHDSHDAKLIAVSQLISLKRTVLMNYIESGMVAIIIMVTSDTVIVAPFYFHDSKHVSCGNSSHCHIVFMR